MLRITTGYKKHGQPADMHVTFMANFRMEYLHSIRNLCLEKVYGQEDTAKRNVL